MVHVVVKRDINGKLDLRSNISKENTREKFPSNPKKITGSISDLVFEDTDL